MLSFVMDEKLTDNAGALDQSTLDMLKELRKGNIDEEEKDQGDEEKELDGQEKVEGAGWGV